MTAGLPQDRTHLDNDVGSVARSMFAIMAAVERQQTYLTATPDATLLAPPFNYNAAEIADMKSAFTELDDLRKVFNGLASAFLTGTKDYRVFARRLIGTGQY